MKHDAKLYWNVVGTFVKMCLGLKWDKRMCPFISGHLKKVLVIKGLHLMSFCLHAHSSKRIEPFSPWFVLNVGFGEKHFTKSMPSKPN